MHLIVAFITALASVLFALDRLGVDIGWLNPWAWRRRRRWLKQYHANPAFNLDSPMEAIALLLTATARIDGDISSEEKQTLKQIFQDTFNQTPKDAAALLVSSTYLLNQGDDVLNRPEEVLARSLSRFTEEQKRSAMELLVRIASVGGPASELQAEYIDRIGSALRPDTRQGAWS